jgi:hypothetical protein
LNYKIKNKKTRWFSLHFHEVVITVKREKNNHSELNIFPPFPFIFTSKENSLSTMDYEPEFLYPISKKDMETVKYYFDNETEFMPARNFFTNDLNILYRMHAVSVIAKVTCDFMFR